MNKQITQFACALAFGLAFTTNAYAASKTLLVPVRFQEQSQWCWNACTNMVMKYYGRNFAEQCEIAEVARLLDTADFGNTHCCLQGNANLGNSAVVGCNQPLWPQNTQSVFNIATTTVNATISFADSKTELNANRPFMVNWAWNTGGAHLLVVKGFADATSTLEDRFTIVNPGYNIGEQIMDYSDVVGCAAGPGCTSPHLWTVTIKTQTPAAAGDKALLYSSASFAGTLTTVTASTSDLAAASNTTSSAKVRGVPYVFFDQTNYGTPAWPVTPRDYSGFAQWGQATDNLISSVMKMPAIDKSSAIVLYTGENYTGTSTTITGNTSTMPAGFNNSVSSAIVVSALWQLHSDASFAGNPYALTSYGGPKRDGFYPTAASWGGPDNDASSVAFKNYGVVPLDGQAPVIVYASQDLSGRAVMLTANDDGMDNLADIGFDNTISSIRTYGGEFTVYTGTGQSGTARVLAPNHWYRTAAEWGGTDNTISSLGYDDVDQFTGE